ncbi:hypothetical protein [Mangrovicoccus algicola]|uniref:Uncharacterized protein n=1 Tax=Mangrovicoccus algicola TaxID=2771008 RepID=A0A8J6YT77_9RHOB|nr:hypothetical protein [Mangrovicoccus algicola]MBE3637367.1 hypothetical protein [Mangrovicoccus algicola]
MDESPATLGAFVAACNRQGKDLNHLPSQEILSSSNIPFWECRLNSELRGYISVRQENDLDAQNKKQEQPPGFIPYSLSEIVGKEAALIALITGIGYYLTYEFQSSYLRYFGVDEVFVDLEVSKIIVAAGGVALLSIMIYNTVYAFPMRALEILADYSFVSPHVLFPLVLLMFSMALTGFSYISQAIVFYLLIVGGWNGIALRRRMRSGTLWRDIVQESMDQDREVRSWFLGPVGVDSRYGSFFVVAVAVFASVNLLGNWAGNRAASREGDFMIFDYRDREVAVIGTYRDQFIGAEIERGEEVVSLTGSVFLVPSPSSVGDFHVEMMRVKIQKFEFPGQNSIERVTFEDAWRRNIASIRGWISVSD